MFRRTTTVTILSDKQAEDEYGDEVDRYEVQDSGVPAHIGQKNRTFISPTSGRPVTIREFVGLLPAYTNITLNHRVRDERSGQIFTIDHVQEPRISTGAVPTRVEMKTVE